MDPYAALLALLAGRSLGPGDVVPRNSPGTGVPSVSGVGSALPGLSYSPYALGGSPFSSSPGPSRGTMSDPTGQAFGNGVGASGLGTSDFLTGALFNQLFPSSAPALAPTAARAGASTGLFDFGMMPTSGEVGVAAGGPSGSVAGGGQGGAPSVGPGPDISVGNAVAANAPGLGGFGYAGPIGSSPYASTASMLMSALAPSVFGINPFGIGMQALNQLGGYLAGLNTSPLGGAKVNSPEFSAMLNTMTPEQVQMVLAQPATSPLGNFTGGVAGQQASVGGTFGAGQSAAPGQAGGRGGTGVEGVTGAVGPPVALPVSIAARSGETNPPDAPTAPDPPDTSGMTNDADAAGVGGSGGAAADAAGGTDSLLCNYALGNCGYTGAEATRHRRAMGALAERAFRETPELRTSFQHYLETARPVIDRIETMDPARRTAAHADLKRHLVQPFLAAATQGHAKEAGRVLRAYTIKAAKQHGVTIPPAHLEFAARHLGPLEPPTDAQAAA